MPETPGGLKAIERFALDFVFPTVPSLNLSVFLFLLLAVIGRQIPAALTYVQSRAFAYEFIGHGIQDDSLEISFYRICFSVIVIAVFLFLTWLITAMLSGKINATANLQTPTGTNAQHYRGFSVVLYIFSILGMYIGNPSASDDMMLLIVCGAIVAFFGIIFITQYAEERLSSREQSPEQPLSQYEVFFSVLIAGGFFMYYLLSRDASPLSLLCSAYASFVLLAGVYRAVVGALFSPRYS